MEPTKPKERPYMVTRQITPDECPWLSRTFNEGDIVYQYSGSTYKCIAETGLPRLHYRLTQILSFNYPKMRWLVHMNYYN